MLADRVTKIINWFYIAPINKIIPHQTFLYAACGGINMVFNWGLYYFLYNIVFQKESVDLGFITLSARVLAFWISFPIVFCSGFLLNKNIAFTRSILQTRTQVIRYAISVSGSVLLSYIGIEFFDKVVGLWATPSYVVTSCITAIYSYLMQKYFTFKGHRTTL